MQTSDTNQNMLNPQSDCLPLESFNANYLWVILEMGGGTELTTKGKQALPTAFLPIYQHWKKYNYVSY